jgi:hypothetical protein
VEQTLIDDIFLDCILNMQKIKRDDLNFPKLLSATNPFTLFDDMLIDEIVSKIISGHIERSEETIRGNLLESVAIKINNIIQGGIKSKEEDVDLEIPITNSFYGLKNSPNWGNANQQKAVGQTNEKMKKLHRNFAVLCLYGKSIKRKVEKFNQFGGQDSWFIISGETDKDMYKKVLIAMNNNKDAYRQFVRNIYICDMEKSINWMVDNFYEQNKLNLNKLYEYISGSNKIAVTKW